MPLNVDGHKYKHLRDLISSVKRKHPEVENPAGYAATIARNVEPNFDEKAAAEKRRKAKEKE